MGMTREERDKLRKTLLYLADVLVTVDTMKQTPNCNDCGVKRECPYAPEWGAHVRYNCPLWRAEKDEEVAP